MAYKLQSGKLASYFVAVIHGILAQVANRARQPWSWMPVISERFGFCGEFLRTSVVGKLVRCGATA
jgi:hypothetical protein